MRGCLSLSFRYWAYTGHVPGMHFFDTVENFQLFFPFLFLSLKIRWHT